MIFDFFKKQKEIKIKKELLIIMINSLNIPEEQKRLYLESLEILDINWINNLYREIWNFIENIEMKEIDEINKSNFSNIAWMRKKEIEEKKKEINSFSFLIYNF